MSDDLRAENKRIYAAMDEALNHWPWTTGALERLLKMSSDRFKEIDVLFAVEGPATDHHGPQDTAHRSAKDTIDHLLGGRVTDPVARQGLRGALDKADKLHEPTGRQKADTAVNRAMRFDTFNR